MTWDMYQDLVNVRSRGCRCRDPRADPARRWREGVRRRVPTFHSFRVSRPRGRPEWMKSSWITSSIGSRVLQTKPTIAQVQGVAAGGGCAIAFTRPASRRLNRPATSDRAQRLATVFLAVSYEMVRRPRRPRRRSDLFFTGRLIDGAEVPTARHRQRSGAGRGSERTVRPLAHMIVERAADDPRDEGNGPPRPCQTAARARRRCGHQPK